MKKFGLALLLGGLLALVLAGCSSEEAFSTELDLSELPAFLHDAPHNVRLAYAFAMEHPDELTHYPCYCGCGKMGHEHNLHCYIQDIDKPTGAITFDYHALGCGICVDITLDVMRLRAEGKSRKDIRAYIDARYSAYGPSTNTPLVQ
jgi:hypothetical protein